MNSSILRQYWINQEKKESFVVSAHPIPNRSDISPFKSESYTNSQLISKNPSSTIKEFYPIEQTNGEKHNNLFKSFKVCCIGCIIGSLVMAIGLAVFLAIYFKDRSSNIITTTTTATSVSVKFSGKNSTTIQTTSSTTTDTTTTTTTTTVCSNNPTTVVFPNNTQTLWSMSNPSSAQSTYMQVSVSYIAQSTLETLTFDVINIPAYTWIDDVSVIDMTTSRELLYNGDFESGSCCPYWSGSGCTSYMSGNAPYNGSYCIYNGATTTTYMQQTFNTFVGRHLSITFWTMWTGSSNTGISTSVTIQS